MVDVENIPPNQPQTVPGKSQSKKAELTLFPDDAPIEVKVRANIEQLELLDQTYFGKDRVKKIRELLDASCALLDTKPIDLV